MFASTFIFPMLACHFGEEQTASDIRNLSAQLTQLQTRMGQDQAAIEQLQNRVSALENKSMGRPTVADSSGSSGQDAYIAPAEQESPKKALICSTKEKTWYDHRIRLSPPEEEAAIECVLSAGTPNRVKFFLRAGLGPVLFVVSNYPFTFDSIGMTDNKDLSGSFSCRHHVFGKAYCGEFSLAGMYREQGDEPTADLIASQKNQMFSFSTVRARSR